MSIKAFLSTIFITCSVCTGSVITLDFDSLPSDQGWDFGGWPDACSLSGDVLTINTMDFGLNRPGDTGGGASYKRSEVMNMDTFSLSIRARCLDEEISAWWTPHTFYFAVVVNNQVFNFILGTDKLSLLKGNEAPANIYDFDNTEFHNYVLEATPGNPDYTLTVDGTHVFQGQAAIADDPSASLIAFGDGASTGNAHGEITSLTFRQPANNTPPGDDVSVNPVDPETGEPSPVIITFDNVEAAGETTVTTSSTGPFVPTQLKLGNPPVYFDIETDATFSDEVTVCIDYSGIQFGNEDNLKLLHWTGSGWVDVTLLPVDTENDLICGTVTALSPFVVVETNLSPIAVAYADTYAAPVNVDFTFDGTASNDPDGTVTNYAWTCGDTTIGSSEEVFYSFSEPGVHRVVLTVSDDTGAQDSDSLLVAVYDPTAGFVTGGGWIDSPEGAYTVDPLLTGKANFGFVAKYKKGTTTPTGQTEFRFRAGDLDFHSTQYQWLVIAGPHAKFKGSGAINGEGDYGFMLTAADGQINGGGGSDKFRIKIWERETEDIVYDNQMEDWDEAEATEEIEGGSIVIHAK
jgi:hypothetical protein